MSTQRLRRAWWRAGTVTTLIALIGVATVPTVTASAEEHCAAVPIERLATGELVTAEPVCFETLAEAISYGTNGRVNLPAGTTGADLLAAQALGQVAGISIDPLSGDGTNAGGPGGPDNGDDGGNTAIHFKGYGGSGSSVSVFNIYCTGGEWWDVSSSFDNRIRSTRNPCYRTKHHDYDNRTGSYRSTWGQYSTGSLYDFPDRANSVSYVP